MRGLRRHLSFANVTSLLALIVALGGTAVAARLIDGGDVKNNSLTGKDIKNGSVSHSDLGNGSVGSGEITDGAVGSGEIGDGSVGSSDLADGSVGTGEIENGSVGGDDLGDGSVGSGEIADGSVGGDDLADGSVGGDDLADGSVGSGEIADGSVGSDDVADGSLTTADLVPGTIPAVVAPGATVPSGATLRGVFNPYMAQATPGATNGIGYGTSFGGFQLSARPLVHVIGEGDPGTATCPGTPAAPTAQSGHVCIYMTEEPADAGAVVQIIDPSSPLASAAGLDWTPATEASSPFGDGRVSKFGFGMLVVDGVGNSTSMWGTWAATG